jgi:ATP-dependent protease ClpP protease subunit
MKKSHRKLSPRVFNFSPIVRAKQIPVTTAKSLGLENISGENKLEVRNDGDEAHVYLSGAVGGSWWDDSGITEKEVREALATIPKGKKIHAHINSEGGSVQEGLGIYNAFKERSGDITAHIDGYACSIASVIPLAAGKVVSPDAAIWMIHCASCYCGGNADDMDQTAVMLREHDEMLAEILSKETGQTMDKIRADMKAETWIRGSQAVEYGLADECDESDCSNRLNKLPKAWLDRCKNIPANIYNSLLISAPTQGAAQPKQKPHNNMNKAIVVALLAMHGILDVNGKAFTENSTEAELEAGLKKIPAKPAAAATPAPADNTATLNKIIRDRIADKIDDFIAENKITKDEREIWIEAALKDDTKTFNILAAKPAMSVGGAAAGTDLTTGRENEAPSGLQGRANHITDKLKNLADSFKGEGDPLVRNRKIYDAMKRDWTLLIQDAARRDSVRNENTFSSSLTTNFLILGATTQASPKFASVKMFARDTSVDPYKPLATGQMKFNTTAQDGSTTQTNATNFESGDSTVTNVAITVSQYTEAFHLTNSQLNSGLRMEDLVTAKLASLGSKISKVLAANITAANFSTLAPIIRGAGAFGFGDLQTLWGQLKKANRKNLMLDGPYLAKLINTPTLFQATPVVPGASWKNFIGLDYLALHTEWSAAGNNIIGFGCDPQALGIIAGLPLIDTPAVPGGILAQASGMIEGVDLPIAVYAWFNTSTRTYWVSFDLMFGANALDTTIGNVIASGTPS